MTRQLSDEQFKLLVDTLCIARTIIEEYDEELVNIQDIPERHKVCLEQIETLLDSK